MSDRQAGIATLEERIDDVRAVMDAAQSERARRVFATGSFAGFQVLYPKGIGFTRRSWDALTRDRSLR